MWFHRHFLVIVFARSLSFFILLPTECLAKITLYERSLQQDLNLDQTDIFETQDHHPHSSSGGNTEDIDTSTGSTSTSTSISTSTITSTTSRSNHLRHQYYDHKESELHINQDSKSIIEKGELGEPPHPFVPSRIDFGQITSQFIFFGTPEDDDDDDNNNNANNFNNGGARSSKARRKLSKEGNDFEGWVPSTFPDPLQDPERCNIPLPYRYGDDNNKNKSSILFCDPDEELNDQDRNSIGNALVDFSLHHDLELSGCDTENNYNVGVAGDWKSYRMTGTAFANLTGGRGAGEEKSEVSSLGGSFTSEHEEKVEVRNIRVEVGVAIAKKLDVSGILGKFQFFSFEDMESMTDDAAQFFASILHNQWFDDENVNGLVFPNGCEKNQSQNQNQIVNGILIFLSIEDRVCFISSGDSITSVLPWWRLEKVVTGMRANLKRNNYSAAIVGAIQEISDMLNKPPTAKEKLKDFFARFGLVFIFSICTFSLAVYGEIRERQRRYEFAEINTHLTAVEEEKARMLQKSFKTSCCPICLEDFIREDNVESDGVPLHGSDGKPLKMLRCGHIFCATCWRTWIESGNGDLSSCPVCRRDIAKAGSSNHFEAPSEEQSLLEPTITEETNHDQTYGSTTTITFQGLPNSNDPNVEISIL